MRGLASAWIAGCRTTTSAPTAATTRSAAKKKVERIGKAGDGRGANPAGWTTSAAIDRFLASPGLSESTRRAYASDLADFACWLRATAALSTTSTSAHSPTTPRSSARGRRGLAPSTIARRLAAVRSFIRFTLGAARVPEIALPPRRRRRLPDAPKLADVEALRRRRRRRRAARAPEHRDPRAHLLLRPPQRRGRRAPARRRRLRAGGGARARQGRQGARRPARRAGRPRGRRLPPRRAAVPRPRRERRALPLGPRPPRSTRRSCDG